MIQQCKAFQAWIFVGSNAIDVLSGLIAPWATCAGCVVGLLIEPQGVNGPSKQGSWMKP